MNEFPKAFPDLESFVRASLIGDYTHFMALSRLRPPLNSEIIQGVTAIMTPRVILEQTAHEREIITTERYPSFDLLRKNRGLIRDLKLVPARSPPVQEEYERMQKETFLSLARNHYINGSSGMTLVREMFPSDLPAEVGQYVVWLGEDSIPDYRVAELITMVMDVTGIPLDDIILFERSRNTNTPFVKVAVPEFRHIHMWTRGEIHIRNENSLEMVQ